MAAVLAACIGPSEIAVLTKATVQQPGAPVDLDGTEWVLTSLHGNDLLEGSHITLNFGPEGFGGFAGCNRYGGEYAAANEGELAAHQLWLTEMECEMPGLQEQEQSYIEALNDAAAYRVMDDRLEIEDAAGKTMLVFAQKEEFVMNPDDLPGTAWQLASLNGSPFIEGSITLVFHSDHRVSGHVGCRDYVASYQASGDDIGFPSFAMMGSFEPCSEASLTQESEYTTVLGWAADYRLNEGRLEILTERGEKLVFESSAVVTPTATLLQPTPTPEQRDCTGPNAFPTEEAELVWPQLREVQPAQAATGDEVKIMGAGGNLHWDNACGQFWLESARDFQLFFDGEPLGFIQCYASMCVADLMIPSDAAPGTHTISVEGGSSLSIEVNDNKETNAGPIVHYFRANVKEADPGDTIVLEWSSSGATAAVLYPILPSEQLPQSGWEVAPTGVYTYEIPSDARNSSRFYLHVTDETERDAGANLTVRLRCPVPWFFSPAPDICATDPILSNAAEQHFERGVMIWVWEKDSIFVLYDDGPSPVWETFTDEWQEGEPDPDPSLAPPDGLYQPVRGFGKVWREHPQVRDRLGWAVDQEMGFSTVMQGTTRFKYNSVYLRALDGNVWHLGPERSSWEKIPVTEQSAPSPTVLPTPAPEPPVILSFMAEPTEADPGGSVHLAWESSGGVKAAIQQWLPSNVLGAGLAVPASGSTEVMIGEHERLWHEFRLMVSNATGQTAERSLTVQIRCPYEYFFAPPTNWTSNRCPLKPATFPQAAEQIFEHGRMIWLQEIPSENDGWGKAQGPTIYVLYNYYVNGESTGGQFQTFDDTWTSDEQESDPSIVPPEGLYQPIRGFGKVWRNNPEVRERLGWALATERGFDGAYQVDWRDPYHVVGNRYIRTADGLIIIWLGEANNWGFVTP